METMLNYINETPRRYKDIIDNSYEYTRELVSFYLDNNCKDLYLIASGSSYNGCYCAISFIKHITGLNVTLETPFNFINHEIDYIDRQMFIAISQSGCSTNTLDAIKVLKEKDVKVAALVGRDDCDAKDIADITVNWRPLEEKIGFVTKGVSTLACFLMCFALELKKALNNLDEDKYQHIKNKLSEVIDIHPEMVESTIDLFNDHKKDFTSRSDVYVLSSGPNLGTAKEAALKIAETSCINAYAYEVEEFLHGPLYPLTDEALILIIDNNDDPSSSRMIDIALALKDITDKVYVISNDNRFDDDHSFRTNRQTCLHRSPLYKLACVQTLAYLMSEATNKYEPHEKIKQFKKANKVSSKSRDNLYLDLQKVNNG